MKARVDAIEEAAALAEDLGDANGLGLAGSIRRLRAKLAADATKANDQGGGR